MRVRLAAMGLLMSAATVAAFSSPAGAATSPVAGFTPALVAHDSVSHITTKNGEVLTVSSHVGKPVRVTHLSAADAAANPQMARSAAAGFLWTTDWHQQEGSGAWREKQQGAFAYDGHAVWVHALSGGGYHWCGVAGTYSIGGSINHHGCPEYGDPSTAYVQAYDWFRLDTVVKGVGMSFEHSMHANGHPNGIPTFYYA